MSKERALGPHTQMCLSHIEELGAIPEVFVWYHATLVEGPQDRSILDYHIWLPLQHLPGLPWWSAPDVVAKHCLIVDPYRGKTMGDLPFVCGRHVDTRLSAPAAHSAVPCAPAVAPAMGEAVTDTAAHYGCSHSPTATATEGVHMSPHLHAAMLQDHIHPHSHFGYFPGRRYHHVVMPHRVVMPLAVERMVLRN